MKPFDRLELVRCILSRHTEDEVDPRRHYGARQVAKSTSLRRAAASTGNVIPTIRKRAIGSSGKWVGEHDSSPFQPRQGNKFTVSCQKFNVRHTCPLHVPSCAIVNRFGKSRPINLRQARHVTQPFSRMIRAFCLCQSRLAASCRLSVSFLPSASASFNFAMPFTLKYISTGTIVMPLRSTA